MPTYEYRCSDCGEVTDDLRKVDERLDDMVCHACSGKAKFIISTPQIRLDGCSGDFPTASDRWERIHKQKLVAERKLSNN